MKFQCQQCKTRYSIADEKVRGKILKIRCKNCEAIITVREGMGVDEPEGKRTGATVALTVPQLPDDLEAELKGSKGGKPGRGSDATKPGGAAAPPIPGDRNETLALAPSSKGKKRKGSKSGVAPMPTSGRAGSKAENFPRPDSSASKAPATLDDEWFVSVDGEQAGPFTLEQARDRVKRKQPEEELHAWRDGFDEWLPVENIPELRSAVPPAAVKERIPIQPGADDDDGMGGESAPNLSGLVRDNLSPDGGYGEGRGPSAGDDDPNLDFDIGEASRVVRMPMLAPGMGSAGASLGPAGLPGMASSAPAAAPGGATAMLGTNGAARAAALLERAQQSRVEPPKRKSRVGVILAALGALVLVAGGSAVLWYTTRDDSAGRVGRDGFAMGPDVYDQGYLPGQNRPVAKDGKPLPSGTVAGRPVRPRAPQGGRTAGDGTIANPYGPGISGPQGGGVGGGNMGVDLNDEARPLTPDDVVMTAGNAANQTGIRLCYEHALKKDPTLAVARMNVTISINTDGVVTSVGMPKREQTQFLTNCLDSRIRRWRFRKSTEGLTAEFPLIFSKRS